MAWFILVVLLARFKASVAAFNDERVSLRPFGRWGMTPIVKAEMVAKSNERTAVKNETRTAGRAINRFGVGHRVTDTVTLKIIKISI